MRMVGIVLLDLVVCGSKSVMAGVALVNMRREWRWVGGITRP